MTRFVLGLIKPYRAWLAIVLCAMVVEVLMSLAAPWPLKLVLDDALGAHRLPDTLHWAHDLGIGRHTLGVALFAGIATVAVAIAGGIAAYVDNYYTASIGQWVANDLRLRIYEHMQRLSLSYYDKSRSAVLMSTITTDVATVQNFASSSTLGILVDVVTIVFMLVLMVWLDWDFTLIALAAMPLLIFFVFRLKRVMKTVSREVRARQSDIMAVVQEGLGSVRTIKAFGRQDLEAARMAAASRASTDAALKARKLKSVLSPAVALVVALCTGVVLWKGTALVVAGTMTIGALTVYLAYLGKFFKPVKDLASMASTIAQTHVALERIQKVLDADEIVREKADARSLQQARGELAFDRVVFGYSSAAPVLDGVSFSIPAGQMVAIVGGTGSGKSTVASLIPRFYDPRSGRVSIDGVDVRDYKLADLRAQIGYVLQETVLFRGTIAENIAYGRPGASAEEIVEAARLANADEFIRRLPDGYDSFVGERGDTLSGGQRQRIGIARALVRNCPILILDEPTAALDTESERLVIEALGRLMAGRTVLMIAHRLSSIRHADRIVVLDHGVVAEQGSHDELLRHGGHYAALHRAQFVDDRATDHAAAAAAATAAA
ncbi:ABC transporter ATP-binding protein [Variovorax sp. KK3]|uniref:ABC transporter ATP-binding protein n=1 Tax=Variovorax sp. KK3 TaxID=1855728 RepID=UPI00097BE90B|nr:ABC transporter ATP-binding protein [Variovorax sp. KK3]